MISKKRGRARASTAEVNPAGHAYSEDDYKNGRVRSDVDRLHALTFVHEEREAGATPVQPLPITAAMRVHIHDVPDDALGLLPPMLTHGEARALAQSSRRLHLVVGKNYTFSLTRTLLNADLLCMTRKLMVELRRHEQAVGASVAPHLQRLNNDGDIFKYWGGLNQAEEATDRQAHLAHARRLKSDLHFLNHMTPERGSEVRAVLQVSPEHREWFNLLNECEALVVRFDPIEFTQEDRDAACRIHARLGYQHAEREFFAMGLDPVNGDCDETMRETLEHLRLDVLDKALRAILALETTEAS